MRSQVINEGGDRLFVWSCAKGSVPNTRKYDERKKGRDYRNCPKDSLLISQWACKLFRKLTRSTEGEVTAYMRSYPCLVPVALYSPGTTSQTLPAHTQKGPTTSNQPLALLASRPWRKERGCGCRERERGKRGRDREGECACAWVSVCVYQQMEACMCVTPLRLLPQHPPLLALVNAHRASIALLFGAASAHLPRLPPLRSPWTAAV